MTLSVEEAWDKGCTDIMYMIIKYPNHYLPSYTTKAKLCEHVVTEKFKFPLQDLNTNSHHRAATHCVTIELRRPSKCSNFYCLNYHSKIIIIQGC